MSLGGAALVAGCVAIADIGDIEFGPIGPSGGSSSGGSAASGGTGGTGGAAAAGGTGASAGHGAGGSGGAEPTCSDGVMNGDETGVDCGGARCDECAEDCTNGEDDDGNDLVDCADPLCAGYGCAPSVPTNWSGPLVVYLGDSPAPTSCGALWPDALPANASLDAPAASCSCTCGSPTGASCGLPTVSLWDPADCSGNPSAQIDVTAAGQCLETGAAAIDSARSSPIPVTGGSCQADLSQNLPAPTWAESALLCGGAPSGGGCTDSQSTCLPRPSSPFGTTFCISASGDLPCPDGAYADRHVVYLDYDDDRGCTACTCSDPSGISCVGEVRVHQQDHCAGQSTTLPANGSSCVNGNASRSLRYSLTSGPSGGSCSPSGGQPTGSAVASEPVTVCCVP